MAKPILGDMTITTLLYSRGLVVSPVNDEYNLDTVISDEDTMTALSMVVTGDGLNESDVDVFIDFSDTPAGTMHFDTDHWDYVPGAPVSLLPGHHHIKCTFADDSEEPLTTTGELNFESKSLLAPAFTADNLTGETPIVVTFTDATTNTPTTRWRDFGDGHFSNVQNPVHTYYKPGKYTVKLVVTSEADTQELEKVDYLEFTETTPGQDNIDHIDYGTKGLDSRPAPDAGSVVEDDDRTIIEGETQNQDVTIV